MALPYMYRQHNLHPILMVAMKHDMINALTPNICSYWTDSAYTVEEVIEVELNVLMVLDWRVSIPTAATFLEVFWMMIDAHQTIKDALQFYLDCTLLFHETLAFKPSDVAFPKL